MSTKNFSFGSQSELDKNGQALFFSARKEFISFRSLQNRTILYLNGATKLLCEKASHNI